MPALLARQVILRLSERIKNELDQKKPKMDLANNQRSGYYWAGDFSVSASAKLNGYALTFRWFSENGSKYTYWTSP